jgi:hypothetical protein
MMVEFSLLVKLGENRKYYVPEEHLKRLPKPLRRRKDDFVEI